MVIGLAHNLIATLLWVVTLKDAQGSLADSGIELFLQKIEAISKKATRIYHEIELLALKRVVDDFNVRGRM